MDKKRSARKRQRQSLKRRASNKGTKTRVRTSVRKFDEAVEAKDKATAAAALRAASRELDSAAAGGVIHKNTAARRKSRLAKRLARASTT